MSFWPVMPVFKVLKSKSQIHYPELRLNLQIALDQELLRSATCTCSGMNGLPVDYEIFTDSLGLLNERFPSIMCRE